jgi:hypothetical protein
VRPTRSSQVSAALALVLLLAAPMLVTGDSRAEGWRPSRVGAPAPLAPTMSVTSTINGALGSLVRNGAWTVAIAPGAIAGTTTLTVAPVAAERPTISLELGDPSLNAFSRPVLLAFHTRDRLTVRDLTIYWWSPSDQRWIEVPGVMGNTTTGDLVAPLQHFSIYCVGSKAGW